MFELRFSLLAILIFFSCNTGPDEKILERDGKQLADLYCKARELRDQRFLLADLIRFTEDSLRNYQGKLPNMYQSRLDSLNLLTNNLHLETKTIADSINNTQEIFYNNTYRSKEDRKSLDLAFQKAVNMLCPEK